MAESLEDWTLVCSLAELVETNRKRIKMDDKDIVIIKAKGNVYALDSFCYHAGGPLYIGDIEDFGGKTCIVCPWHKYKVAIDRGEMVYQSCDPHNLSKPAVWKSSGVKQRTHAVTVRDGNVYIKFTDCTGKIPSDQYNNKDYRERLGLS
ncbi:Rieske domain-containing protein-like [Pecten maximus]|uniref:Rieske domain-containing protein-like n=1 Tax=Pecten maximus TaxID=6579 RepID=UPI00145895AE|nr:Rieske domain-containing protein-like [Pecten maximus]